MAKRTLVKSKSNHQQLFDGVIGAVSSPKVENNEFDDAVWLHKPPTLTEYCNDWLSEPMFKGKQQEFGDAMVGTIATEFSTDYDEGHGFWGKGCIIGSTLLKDEFTKKSYTIKELCEQKREIKIKGYDTKKNKVISNITGIPFSKGKEKIYKVRTKSGREIFVTSDHMFYSDGRWVCLENLSIGKRIMINNVDKEKLRREKISESMKGKKKSKAHAKNIKNAENSGRFEKNHKPEFNGSMMSDKQKESIRNKLKGRKLSNKTRKRMSDANKGLKNHKEKCKCLFCKTKRGEFKVYRSKKFVYGGVVMRSSWEIKFAKYLDNIGVKYEYEPKSFILSNGTRYIPDFYLPTEDLWVEIKGYLERKSEDKMKLFISEYKKYFIVLRHSELKQIGIL